MARNRTGEARAKRLRYAANPDHYRAIDRAWYAKNRERRLTQQRANYKANPKKHIAATKKSIYKRRYGMTFEDRDKMLAAQGNCCAICLTEKPHSKHGWSVDHNHDTGVVRGILCVRCNTGLGQFKDNPALLQKASVYLLTPGEQI
jgi:hypothetical protein